MRYSCAGAGTFILDYGFYQSGWFLPPRLKPCAEFAFLHFVNIIFVSYFLFLWSAASTIFNFPKIFPFFVSLSTSIRIICPSHSVPLDEKVVEW